jgi:site-specific DNA recombinase
VLQQEMAQADEKLRRLYKLVEDGLTDIDETLADRLTALKSERDRAKAALERIKVQLAPQLTLDADQVERFGAFMRERITTGDTTFRKGYLRSIVDAIEVDDKVIRIHGSKASLKQAVIAEEQIGRGVRSFIERPERWVTVCSGHMGDTSRQASLAGGVECPGRSVRLWKSVFGSSRVCSTARR